MGPDEAAQVERLLARLIARAYWADHPELGPLPGEVPPGTSPPSAPIAGACTPRVQEPRTTSNDD